MLSPISEWNTAQSQAMKLSLQWRLSSLFAHLLNGLGLSTSFLRIQLKKTSLRPCLQRCWATALNEINESTTFPSSAITRILNLYPNWSFYCGYQWAPANWAKTKGCHWAPTQWSESFYLLLLAELSATPHCYYKLQQLGIWGCLNSHLPTPHLDTVEWKEKGEKKGGAGI